MSEPLPEVELSFAGRRFRPISARGPAPHGSVGCIFLLGIPLALLGSFFVSLPIWSGEPLGESWVAVVVGGAFALVGFLLVYGGIRGWRAKSLPPPEIALEREATQKVGGRFAVRVRQPGPIRLEQLKLVLTCERRYRRPIKRGSSTSTVDDSQLLWDRELLALRDTTVPSGEVLERFVEVEVPADAQPTGPAQPDGRIRWTLELSVEAGLLRGWRSDFEIEVGGGPAAG